MPCLIAFYRSLIRALLVAIDGATQSGAAGQRKLKRNAYNNASVESQDCCEQASLQPLWSTLRRHCKRTAGTARRPWHRRSR
jgi:hypothetical protein